MQEFILPDFLKNKSIEEIHKKMLALLPENIDKSQGQHVYNLTRPTALIAAELCQQTLPNIIRLIFPMWAYGEWLDYHAQLRNITRKAAAASFGKLILSVKLNTEIPEGSLFSTASVDGEPAVLFRTTENIQAETGQVEVPVQCTQTGTVGNVPAHTVIFKISKLNSVIGVDNSEAITGGTESESDESLRERILEYDFSKSVSYVGSVADYKRWSKEVDGVGEATVIPAQDDSGLVTVVLTDSNGEPANEQLCKAVYDHIMSPDNPELRFTPPNAKLSVIPPEKISLSISATVELKPDFSLEQAEIKFLALLKNYLAVCRADKEIRWTQIGKLLASIEGVYDYIDLFLNGKTNNIPITAVQLPQISREDISLTLGVVN